MDQNSSGQSSAQGNQSGASGANRPAVLADLTSSQLDELELQFNEQDHKEWNEITNSYGWTKQQADEVWQWFNQGPRGKAERPEGFPGEGR